MRLPNADDAVVAVAKLRDYLLDLRHDKGSSKARLFYALGYRRSRWQELEADIRSQVLSENAVEISPSLHGRRWEIEAELRGPSGAARIVTGWIILWGEEIPRFVTAYRA